MEIGETPKMEISHDPRPPTNGRARILAGSAAFLYAFMLTLILTKLICGG